MPIHELNDEESLGRAVDHHHTVVIDFWAPWCAPCKGFLPVLEEAAERHPDILFCRVNTEDQKDLARAFEVRSIPTLVVIRERVMIASQPGMLPEGVLEELITKVREVDMDALRREMASAEDEKGNDS
jgi:thioredoxin